MWLSGQDLRCSALLAPFLFKPATRACHMEDFGNKMEGTRLVKMLIAMAVLLGALAVSRAAVSSSSTHRTKLTVLLVCALLCSC